MQPITDVQNTKYKICHRSQNSEDNMGLILRFYLDKPLTLFSVSYESFESFLNPFSCVIFGTWHFFYVQDI